MLFINETFYYSVKNKQSFTVMQMTIIYLSFIIIFHVGVLKSSGKREFYSHRFFLKNFIKATKFQAIFIVQNAHENTTSFK